MEMRINYPSVLRTGASMDDVIHVKVEVVEDDALSMWFLVFFSVTVFIFFVNVMVFFSGTGSVIAFFVVVVIVVVGRGDDVWVLAHEPTEERRYSHGRYYWS
jgi:hypothetical protein